MVPPSHVLGHAVGHVNPPPVSNNIKQIAVFVFIGYSLVHRSTVESSVSKARSNLSVRNLSENRHRHYKT